MSSVVAAFLRQHNIYHVFYPFMGNYDDQEQPNLFDMPMEQLTFDYIKWRPKLQTQLQYIKPYLADDCILAAFDNRIQHLHKVILAFQKIKWEWLPIGVENRFMQYNNEPHDIPIHWKQAHQIEQMQQAINLLQIRIFALEKTKNIYCE